jgi:hypothetical protein
VTSNHIKRQGKGSGNRGRVRIGLLAAILAFGGIALLAAWRDVGSQENNAGGAIAPHLTGAQRRQIEYGEYLKRALPYGIPPMARTRALEQIKAMPAASLPAGGAAGDNAPAGAAAPIQWSSLGPQPILRAQGMGPDGFCSTTRIHASGRATAIAFGAVNTTIYLGTANGGVWKTTNGGGIGPGFWTALTDKEPSLAVGALTVIPNADSSKDIVYVGTGEGNLFCDNEWGQGILKSTDGGRSWVQLGEPNPFDRMAFTRIAVAHGAGQAGKDLLYAATQVAVTSGAAYTVCFGATSAKPGLFRSTDGGVGWAQISGTGGLPPAGKDPGAATDVILDPANSKTVYVAIAGTGNNAGGLWKSTDGGGSWTQFTPANNNFPQAATRINLDISADGSSLWAARTADGRTFDNVYLSTNRGATWVAGGKLPQVGAPNCLNETQEIYDMAVRGDPADFANSLVLGLTGIYRSSDRGLKWAFIGAGNHADFHDLAINAHGIFAANDGGIFLSTNHGLGWNTSLNDGLSITQFQSVALPPDSALSMMGGTQDNGTNIFTAGIGWQHGSEGDGGYTAIDPSAPNIMFTETFNGPSALDFQRSTASGTLGSFNEIPPPGGDPVMFYPPFAEDLINPDRILFGTNRIWESCNVATKPIVCNGTSGTPPAWSDISGVSKPGGLTAGCTSAFCQLTDIQIAPSIPDVVYACSGSDGKIGAKMWVTVNGRSPSPVWTDITAGLPSGVPFTAIAVSPFNAPHVLLGVSGFNAGGNHVFFSSNGDSLHPAWKDISAANPTCTAANSCFPDIPVSAVLFDRSDATEKTYLAGTDIGVFITQDAGVTWQKFDTGTLPAVPIYMLRQNSVLIVAATHGRGIWTLPKSGPINPPGDFSFTASMNRVRVDHTATVLQDGRVLVTGGLGAGAVVSDSAEIYDPGKAQFFLTGRMFDARWEHEAVALDNGMVLVAGGYDAGANGLPSAELFDPAGAGGAGSFTPTASMNVFRIRFTATLLGDGRVLVAGGDNNTSEPTGTAQIFDPAGNGGAGSFGPPLTMVKWREGHTATLLTDGRVLLAGGETFNLADQNTAEILDPAAHGGAGGFVATGSMLARHVFQAAVRLRDGRVLIAGHLNPAEIFNPKGNGGLGSFSSAGDMVVAGDNLSANLLFDGSVLLAGGSTAGFGRVPTASAELFDPARAGTVNAFMLTGSMNDPRDRFRGVNLLNGLVLVTGGTPDGANAIASAELYHPIGLPEPTPKPTGAPTHTPSATATATATAIATKTATATATAPARATATRTATATATRPHTPTATATPLPGTPFIASIPKLLRVGSSFIVKGTGFTPGSVANFFVSISTGTINAGPLKASARSLPTQLTFDVPTTITVILHGVKTVVPMPLGQGFASVVVINTDKGFLPSNSVGALLQGNHQIFRLRWRAIPSTGVVPAICLR